MGSPLERRRSEGRRLSDARDMRALRGLLHDIGHEITTLSYLVEAVRGDTALPEDSGYRLELLAMELSRLTEIIRDGLSRGTGSPPGPVPVRDLAGQLTRLAQAAYPAEVTLLPGPDATAEVSPVLLWRVLSNLVDNAVRAAGPRGRVTVAVRQEGTAVVEVADDGPGFGSAPKGEASLGLDVVVSLLEASGGSLDVRERGGGGTLVRMTLPGQAGAPRVPAHADGRPR
jgi:signal transduction histidine kinase